MANPPAPGSHIAVHLADRALTPLISSSHPSSHPPPPADKTTHAAQSQQSQAQALSSLTTAAITAYDSASRLDLGLPQRILIETRSAGPVILHSYLNPQRSSPRPLSRHSRTPLESGRDIVGQAREDLRPLSGTTEDASTVAEGEEGEAGGRELVNGKAHGGGECESEVLDARGETQAADAEEGEDATVLLPPLLVATVVAAGAGDTMEARRAAAKLERMGREFQKEFVREEADPQEAIAEGEDG